MKYSYLRSSMEQYLREQSKGIEQIRAQERIAKYKEKQRGANIEK